jgi:hypothetical protein
MHMRWLLVISICLLFGHQLALSEEDSSPSEGASWPERVEIISIGGRSMIGHPSVINVLPGEQISFRADVLQFGNACSHPEGCPEMRSFEEFFWSSSDRPEEQCVTRRPETCRDRTEFEPTGNEIIFHIPYAMPSDLTIRVTHESKVSEDSIVLHNAHYPEYSDRTQYASSYDDGRYDPYLYPSLPPPDFEGPNPYYSCYYWSGPYPYEYRWAWWDGCPNWTIRVGWWAGPVWGWPYWGWGWGRGWGWAGAYYYPGFYGYRGWPGYAAPRFARAGIGPHMERPFMGPRGGGYPSGFYGGRRGFRRGWR